jgi:uncharacterized protein YdeI (YjbR/CyaY-like superfamily)
MESNKQVDQYIFSRQEFAKPILEWLRHVIHSAVEVEETIKWSFPHFMYKGKILCSMAAFKEHCVFGIPVLEQLNADIKIDRTAMGQFGRITRAKDLPTAKVLKSLLKEAAKALDEGAKPMGNRTRKKVELLPSPVELEKKLRQNSKAKKYFTSLPPGHQNEYIKWITEAKREETRLKRLATTIDWLNEGKPFNWKYL